VRLLRLGQEFSQEAEEFIRVDGLARHAHSLVVLELPDGARGVARDEHGSEVGAQNASY
jgi:hypothetical protein